MYISQNRYQTKDMVFTQAYMSTIEKDGECEIAIIIFFRSVFGRSIRFVLHINHEY